MFCDAYQSTTTKQGKNAHRHDESNKDSPLDQMNFPISFIPILFRTHASLFLCLAPFLSVSFPPKTQHTLLPSDVINAILQPTTSGIWWKKNQKETVKYERSQRKIQKHWKNGE